MSEVLGTVLLTALTVTLLGGFGAVVLSSLDATSHAPAGDFVLEAAPGATNVTLRFLGGSTFDLAGADIVLRVNGTQALATPEPLAAATPGRFGPGDTLRLPLPLGAPPLGAGTTVAALVVHRETNEAIGGASTVLAGAGGAAFSSGLVSLGTPALGSPNLVADGRTGGTLTVQVASTYGQRFVRSVTADLTALGGVADARFVDDGQSGDATAGDGVHTLRFTAAPSAVPDGASGASASVRVTATDLQGRAATATATLSLLPDPLRGALAGAGPSGGVTSQGKVVGGAAFTRVPGSAQVSNLYLTNFTFIEEAEVRNDVAVLRVSDLVDPTRTWTAWVSFTVCGGVPALESIAFTRDGVSGSATYSPAGCFPINLTSRADVSFPPASRNAAGSTQAWTVSGSPQLFSLENASIGGINGATIVQFGDKTPWAAGRSGLGQADLAWNYRPTPSFTATVTGSTVRVDASASFDLEGPVASYSWDWGDGTTATGTTANRTYLTGGDRTVTLTVVDAGGAANSTSLTLRVPGFSYASASVADIAGGTITNATSLARDGGGDVATFSESGTIPARFGKDFTISVPPWSNATHTLEVRYRATAHAEGLQLHTLANGTHVPRGTLSSTGMTTFTRTLDPSEVVDGTVTVRLLDASRTVDALASQWEVDYVRVHTELP